MIPPFGGITLLFMAFLLMGCPSQKAVSPASDPADGGASVDAGIADSGVYPAEGGDNCAKACSNLRAVHCPVGLSVDGGESCATSCRHARDSHLMPLDIPCAEKAQNLKEAHSCKGWGC